VTGSRPGSDKFFIEMDPDLDLTRQSGLFRLIS
jgi:hypothetical protein